MIDKYNKEEFTFMRLRQLLPNFIKYPINYAKLKAIRLWYHGHVQVSLPESFFLVDFASIKQLRSARQFHSFEPEFLNEFIHYIKLCNVVYDVGAFIGLYSLTALTYNKNITIITVDPDYQNHKSIHRNMKANNFGNYYNFCIALGDKNEVVDFNFSGKYGGSSGHIKRELDSQHNKTVPVYKLDTLIQEKNLPAPELVKIDVEGYETHVLRGMIETIDNYRPIILAEIHPKYLENYQESPYVIDNLLDTKNYIKKVLHVPGEGSKTKHKQYHVSYVPIEKTSGQ